MRDLFLISVVAIGLNPWVQPLPRAYAQTGARAAQLADPGIQPQLGTTTPADSKWGPMPGPLFDPGPPWVGASEAMQGHAEDCTLLSLIADIARMHPEHWKQSLVDKGKGTYAVTLYEGQPPHPVQVVVDNQMPMKGGKLVHARLPKSKVIWALLVEKAVAKLRGSYDLLEGHTPGQMATLTGWHCSSTPSSTPAAELFATITTAVNQHKIVVTSTPDEKHFAALPKDLQQGLAHSHEVSVLAAFVRGDGPVVMIRNPWGNVTSVGDGFVWYPLAKYTRIFGGLTIAWTTPEGPKAKKLIRRSSKRVAKDDAAILEFVTAHGGLRSVQLQKQIKMPSSNLASGLKRLREAGKIKMKGVKAAATYAAA